MHIVDRGHGPPLVLVPSLHGRWEYLRPAVDALAESFRVVSFALVGEPGAGIRPPRGLDDFADQIERTLDDRGIGTAAICGVSFGGLAALRFVARRPERASALILVSTPGPTWQLRPRHGLYARWPWFFAPLFVAETPWRLWPEIAAAIPGHRQRVSFVWSQVRTLVQAPLSLLRMAARARLVGAADPAADCARISVPTLVVTGEPSLDQVVSADGTAEYVRFIPGARAIRIARTGHLGSITRPREFASAVRAFVLEADGAPPARPEDLALERQLSRSADGSDPYAAA